MRLFVVPEYIYVFVMLYIVARGFVTNLLV